MCKNSSAPLINATLWHYLGTYNLDFRRENNSTPGVLIEEIWYGDLVIYFIAIPGCLILISFFWKVQN